MRGRTPALVAAGFLACAAYADAPDPAAVVVSRLASPRYAEREKAARELEALGPAALNALKAARTSGDEEIRARAKQIGDRIEFVERSRRLLAPTRLALKFKDVPLDQAVNEFTRQSGLRVSYSPGGTWDTKRKVTLDTGDVPYWVAVDAFYKAAGLTEDVPPPPAPGKTEAMTQVMGGRLVIRSYNRPMAPAPVRKLTDGDWAGPAVLDRALRVRALPPTFPGNKYDDVKGELTIHLDVDPAATVNLQDVVGIEIRHAAAEDGRPLVEAHPEPEPAGGGLDSMIAVKVAMLLEDGIVQPPTAGEQLAVVLKTGGLRPRALSELSGVLVARVQAPPEPLVLVEKILDAKGRTATADGYSLTVLSVEERANNRLAVRAKLTTAPVREEMNFPVLLKGQARQFINIVRELEVPSGVKGFQVRTADGKPIAETTTTLVRGTSDGRNNSTEVLILVPKPADKAADLSLAYTGRRSALVELPFTLKNVPVP